MFVGVVTVIDVDDAFADVVAILIVLSAVMLCGNVQVRVCVMVVVVVVVVVRVVVVFVVCHPLTNFYVCLYCVVLCCCILFFFFNVC